MPLLNIAISTFIVLAVMPVTLLVTLVQVAPALSLRKIPTVLTAAKNRFWFPGSATKSLTGPADNPAVPEIRVNDAPVFVLRKRPLPLPPPQALSEAAMIIVPRAATLVRFSLANCVVPSAVQLVPPLVVRKTPMREPPTAPKLLSLALPATSV